MSPPHARDRHVTRSSVTTGTCAHTVHPVVEKFCPQVRNHCVPKPQPGFTPGILRLHLRAESFVHRCMCVLFFPFLGVGT